MNRKDQDFASVKSNPLRKINEKLTQAGAWIWEHKKWIIISIATTTGVILLVKKREAMKRLFRFCTKGRSAVEPITETIVDTKPLLISDEILRHRTGIMLTATGLGGKVGMSNREINKRLVSAGLSIRLPCGEYKLTEAGKQLGEDDSKVTPWNKTVQRVQWDEAVLKVILSPEELSALDERKKHLQEIAQRATI